MIRNNGWLNPIAVLSINLFLSLKYLIVYIFDASTIIFLKTVHSHFTFAHPLFDQLWSFSNWPGVSNRWIPRFLEEKQTTEISGLWREVDVESPYVLKKNMSCHYVLWSKIIMSYDHLLCGFYGLLSIVFGKRLASLINICAKGI
jgi:hypothetical protein